MLEASIFILFFNSFVARISAVSVVYVYKLRTVKIDEVKKKRKACLHWSLEYIGCFWIIHEFDIRKKKSFNNTLYSKNFTFRIEYSFHFSFQRIERAFNFPYDIGEENRSKPKTANHAFLLIYELSANAIRTFKIDSPTAAAAAAISNRG